MVKCKKKAVVKFDTDGAARNIWHALVRDFRSSEGALFCRNAEERLMAGIPEFRKYSFPELGTISVGRFKRYAQQQALFKKYRFKSDLYSDEELEKNTLAKFFSEQELLSTYTTRGPLAQMVLGRARKIARSILGRYDPESTINAARFGKKSSIGCPLAVAYIDEKLSNVQAFTSSAECAKWFHKNLGDDPILSKLVAELYDKAVKCRQIPHLSHESLNLVLVPKSWKVYRPITPLTLLALYYSYGVGDQVTEALSNYGLDIRRLQQRHRQLVKQFSLSRTHATVDLKSASQSLTSDLLNSVLPREWFVACKKTFTHQLVVKIDDVDTAFYTASVLPMGNGLTFPVETLVFYCITKAIGELAEVKGVYSVYGDDLIYPSRLHKFTRVIYPMFNLWINSDKTFVKAPFRESCGSDYYRGADVRPFFLPGEHQLLTATKYVSWLYQVYNGLTRRWDESEITGTLYYLLTEISRCGHQVLRIPPSFPDTAGIKTDSPWVTPMGATVLDWSPIYVILEKGSYFYSFLFLDRRPKDRVVKSVVPYYWLALQGLTDEPERDFWVTDFSYMHEAQSQPLNWRKQPYYAQKYDAKTGKTFRKKLWKRVLVSPSRIQNEYDRKRNKSGSVSDWI